MGPADSAHRPALRRLESSIDPKILSKNNPERAALQNRIVVRAGVETDFSATAETDRYYPAVDLEWPTPRREESWRTR